MWDTQGTAARASVSSFAHHGAVSSPRTAWATVAPTSRSAPALRYLGLLSQLCQDPAPLISEPVLVFGYTRACSQLYQERAPSNSRSNLDLGCFWILSSSCFNTFVCEAAPRACHWTDIDVPWMRCPLRVAVQSGLPKLLPNQTWVCKPAHSKANLQNPVDFLLNVVRSRRWKIRIG